MKDIADRLIEARRLRDWSQSDLARAVGVSQGAISNIESGTRKNPRKLLDIAAALGVSPNWLLHGEGGMHDQVAMKGVEWPLERLSLQQWRNLTERDRGVIEDVMMAKYREILADKEAQAAPIGPRRKPHARRA